MGVKIGNSDLSTNLLRTNLQKTKKNKQTKNNKQQTNKQSLFFVPFLLLFPEDLISVIH